MAFDSLKPATSDNYSTSFTQNIRGNFLALAMWLDSTQVSITGAVPTYAKRYNRSSGFTEEYGGSAWANLVQNITGNAGTATLAADASRLGNQLPAYYQAALGFTPVQQGGGAGQGTSKVYLGWLGSALGLQVDSTNFGAIWPIGVTGNAATATNATNAGTATNLSGGSLTTGTNTVSVGAAAGSNTQFMGNASYAAMVSFHRASAYAINMGLDTDNVFRLGGWSDGASVYRWQSDTAGNFTARGNVTAYSDERLKADWAPLPDDFTDRLADLRHGSYTRIDSHERQVGVSAQSLQALLPEAVLQVDGGMLSVAYGNAALVACVALARELRALKAEVARLRSAA